MSNDKMNLESIQTERESVSQTPYCKVYERCTFFQIQRQQWVSVLKKLTQSKTLVQMGDNPQGWKWKANPILE
jgi:hypothetical protein